MTQDESELVNQPTEGVPSRQTNLKIKDLQRLRAQIARLRVRYRFSPSIERESKLKQLIRREADLSEEVGFGANPEAKHGRSKSSR